tara:strand:+ start:431 stop:1057 length:627 start_codon:yes stop_codon:yes gene_type:complete
MLDTILPHFITVIFLITASLIGRTILVFIGQSWVSTFAHTATLTFLPIITFVITKVIAGNIALSLGMVGALSIIRFRNPVKSPFELSIYFASITMGIAASVSFKWFLFFVIALALAFISLYLMEKIVKAVSGKEYFQVSFTEGNRFSTLEIITNKALDILHNDSFLISEAKDEKGYTYILASNDLKYLKTISEKISGSPDIIQYRLNS